MKLITVVFGITVFFLVSALLSGIGGRSDRRRLRLAAVKNIRAEEKTAPVPPKAKKGRLKKELQKRAKARKNDKKKNDKKTAELEAKLEMAGFEISAKAFSAFKLVISGALTAGVLLASPALGLDSDMKLMCCAGAIAAGLILPGKLLNSKIAGKQKAFINELPDVMDLLSVSVEAGLGFDASLIRLYEKNKSPLMEEFMRAQRDIHHGISKRAAYNNMSSRCGVKELTAFLNAMIQAEDMGVSIRSVLRSQAETLREDRRQKAEEKALKAPVTMLMPMVIFIFPVIFIVLLGPAVISMMDLL